VCGVCSVCVWCVCVCMCVGVRESESSAKTGAQKVCVPILICATFVMCFLMLVCRLFIFSFVNAIRSGRGNGGGGLLSRS